MRITLQALLLIVVHFISNNDALNGISRVGILRGHTGAVNCVVYSTDGEYLFSGSDDQTIIEWSIASQSIVQTYKGHKGPIKSISAGSFLYSSSEDQTIKRWNINTGQSLLTMYRRNSDVFYSTVEPYGKYGASASPSGTLTLWILADGRMVSNFRVTQNNVSVMTFNNSHNYLFTGNDDGSTQLWQVPGGRRFRDFVGHMGRVTAINVSLDGRFVLTGGDDHLIIMWDISSGAIIHRFTGHIGAIGAIAFSPDGQLFLSGCKGGLIKLWDAHSGQLIETVSENVGSVNSLVFSPNSKYFASGLSNQLIMIWDLPETINRIAFAQKTETREISPSSPFVREEVKSIVPEKPISIEQNIPKARVENRDGIAVVIGNQNYRGDIPNVSYAVRDSRLISKYVEQALGYRPGNIIIKENMTGSEFRSIFGDDRDHRGQLSDYVKPGISDVFIYYSGHGAPDPNNNIGYLVPVDADPNRLALTGYSLDALYNNLGKIQAKSVTVVIDACFSGASGDGSMLIAHASPIGIQIDDPAARIQNATIITASSGSQIASWHTEKKHGLLTYFFLKGIQGEADYDKDGRISVGEINRYLTDRSNGLPYYARRLHGRDQVPQVWGRQDVVIR